MPHEYPRRLALSLTCVSAVLGALALPVAAAARVPGAHLAFGLVYDCSYTTATTHPAPDVVFKQTGEYLLAKHHHGKKLTGRIQTGTFTQRHNHIRFLSGPLQPPPGVEASYFDTHHLSVEIWQLDPAWVPWDCFSSQSQKLEFH